MRGGGVPLKKQYTAQLTRGVRRTLAKMTRRAEMMTPDTPVAGVDVAMATSPVVFMRASAQRVACIYASAGC